jgi:hypothetical protein
MVGIAIPRTASRTRAADWRKAQAALLLNGTTDAFSVRAGRRPGGGMVASMSGLNWTVSAGSYISSPDCQRPGRGAYLCEFAVERRPGSINAQQRATPRRHPLRHRRRQQRRRVGAEASAASSTSRGRRRRRLRSLPCRANPPAASCSCISTFRATGGGRPSIIAQASVRGRGSGGILPVASLAEANTLTRSEGQYFDDAATPTGCCATTAPRSTRRSRCGSTLRQNAIRSGGDPQPVHSGESWASLERSRSPAPALHPRLVSTYLLLARPGRGRGYHADRRRPAAHGRPTATVALGRRFNTHTAATTEGHDLTRGLRRCSMRRARGSRTSTVVQVVVDAGSIDFVLLRHARSTIREFA